jgi:uncharacterized protein
MLPAHSGLLFLAAVAAGALNSVAGGGSFLAFPALVFSGIAPIVANATNTVALWPGTVASTGAYRRELRSPEDWKRMAPLLVVSMVGAIAGARLLLQTPQATFMQLVPWLLLAATLLFTFAEKIAAFVHGAGPRPTHTSAARQSGFLLLQLAVAVYIGYFGAGAGILLLALFALMGMENIHRMNGFKTLLASCANGVAVITFVIAGAVAWPQAILMTLGAALGGYAGAWYAQRLPQRRVRYLVIVIGAAMTAYFFVRR